MNPLHHVEHPSSSISVLARWRGDTLTFNKRKREISHFGVGGTQYPKCRAATQGYPAEIYVWETGLIPNNAIPEVNK